jgi:HlyD family secretion protein
MKKAFILPLLLLAACTGNKNLPDAYGNFETDEVTLSAENGGKIVALPIEEGTTIKKGDVVAVSDTNNLSLQVHQIEAQTASIEAQKNNIESQIEISNQQLANLARDQRRVSKMLSDGAATEKQKDDIFGQAAVIHRQIESLQTQQVAVKKQAKATEAQGLVLQDKIKNATIKSPINGTILEKYTQLGELAVPGKAVCKMADLSSLILRVYVSENQLSSIKIGQKVTVSIDGKDALKQLDGKIEWIASQAEFTPKIIQTREERVKLVYAVKIRVVNDGSLKIGMPGEVKF